MSGLRVSNNFCGARSSSLHIRRGVSPGVGVGAAVTTLGMGVVVPLAGKVGAEDVPTSGVRVGCGVGTVRSAPGGLVGVAVGVLRVVKASYTRIGSQKSCQTSVV